VEPADPGAGRADLAGPRLPGRLAAWGAYYLSQQLDRGFNLVLLLVAVGLRLLALLRRVGHQLAGFRLDWSDYRGGAGLQNLVIAIVLSVGAGYIFVLSDLAAEWAPVLPRAGYRLLDGWWHLPWLNVSLVVLACGVLGFALLWLFGTVRMLVLARLGREDRWLREAYERAGLIARPDPRQHWQYGDE